MLENLYSELLTEVKNGNRCALLTHLDFLDESHGFISGKYLFRSDNTAKEALLMEDDVHDKIRAVLDTGMPQILRKGQDKAVLIEAFIPNPRLIVFGGGHIALPLVEFASKVGFSVTVIDDRPYFASTSRFPQAEKVICESFERSINPLNLRDADYVVIITRGHKHDGVVLREVLKYNLSYIGMIGSKRRVKAMRDELISEGYDSEKLDSVNAPIGLDINAITPNEIAISIVSQLISCKNKSIIDRYGKTYTFPEFDMEVIEKASEKTAIPKALITVLSTKGSVPRKAGSKMIAFYDGKTYGSIGGGCSEAGVISSARTVMLEKGFKLEHVDLTGSAAEDEGMVCGGVMDVLIEAF